MAVRVEAEWPELTLASWDATRVTVHMWTQIVGKVRLALEPMVNHWWQVPLYVSARGLTTSLMHAGDVGLEMEFDFTDHVLQMRTTRGETREVRLKPQSVADFYTLTMLSLRELGITVHMLPRPVEVAEAIPFAQDHVHRSYDADVVHRFWQQLVRVDRLLKQFRSRFQGKVSPVHFFWGGFDLAVTRFSGKPSTAPPRTPTFMQDAYSHEVISHGFWPGSGLLLEPAFYSYAVPEPAGLKEARVRPEAAYYHRELGEFILPYDAVRAAPSPDQAILAFVDTTYDRAATLAGWDRMALDRKV